MRDRDDEKQDLGNSVGHTTERSTTIPKNAEPPAADSVSAPVASAPVAAAAAVVATARPTGAPMTIDFSKISDPFFEAIRTLTQNFPIKGAWALGDDPKAAKPRFVIEILKQRYIETVDSAGRKLKRFEDFPPSESQGLVCKTRLAEGAPTENHIVTVTQKTLLTFLVRHQLYTSHSGLEMGSMMNDQALIEKETDLFIKFYIRVDPQEPQQDRKFALIAYSKDDKELAHFGKLFFDSPTDDQQEQLNTFAKHLLKLLISLYPQIVRPQLSFFGAGPASAGPTPRKPSSEASTSAPAGFEAFDHTSASPATATPPEEDEAPKTARARLKR